MWLSKHVVSSHLFQLVYLDLEGRAILCFVVWLVVFFSAANVLYNRCFFLYADGRAMFSD